MNPLLPRRRLIPRWRPIANTLATQESLSSAEKSPLRFSADEEDFEHSVATWQSNPTAGHLGDILSFGIHEELSERVLQIASEAIDKDREVTPVQAQLIAALGDGEANSNLTLNLTDLDNANPFQERVRELRRLLRVAPGNTLALLDFAQLKVASGDTRSAERILRGALSLAPKNRLVIRTMARFQIHTGNPDRAHSTVTRALRDAEDPWLMASEIALADAAKRTSVSLQRGRRLIKEAKFRPEHISELAGAIATMELMAGQMKAARDSARVALLKPNDNVIAQAMMEQPALGISLGSKLLQDAVESSHEAQLLRSWNEQDINASKLQAFAWHAEEPFSSRPIQLLAVVNALQGNPAQADKWIVAGLRADPNDAGLWTNFAYTRAVLGRFKDAERAIKKIRSMALWSHGPFVTATEGLIAMKRQAYGYADVQYRTAMSEFTTRGRSDLAAFCMGHYAKQASILGHPNADQLMKEAVDLIERHPSFDAILLFKDQENLVRVADQEEKLRLTNQLIFDPDTNTLTQTPVLSKPGAPGVIFKKPRSGAGG